jgi:hypothetical protein
MFRWDVALVRFVTDRRVHEICLRRGVDTSSNGTFGFERSFPPGELLTSIRIVAPELPKTAGSVDSRGRLRPPGFVVSSVQHLTH